MLIKPGDRQRVLEWLQRTCSGYRNARTRANILPYMGYLTDRYWRAIISDLSHSGEVFSSASRGYWTMRAGCKDPDEVNAALESLQERSAKALDILRGLGKQIERMTDLLDSLTKQGEFGFEDRKKA